MASLQHPGPRTTEGPITYADVLGVLGEGNPHQTNASILRERLGRGSQGTVQKHLDAIRAQLAAQSLPVPSTVLPPPPADTMAALWAAAYAVAEVQTLTRLEGLSAQRDALTLRVSTQCADLDATAAVVDSLRAGIAEVQAACATATTALTETLASNQLQLEADRTEISSLKSNIARVEKEVANDRAMVEKDRTIERQTLNSIIDRLNEQLAQMRSLQIVAATTAEVAENSRAQVFLKEHIHGALLE